MGRLPWTALFSQRDCVWQLTQFLLPGKEIRKNMTGHPDWVKLWVELNCAPNQNNFCYTMNDSFLYSICMEEGDEVSVLCGEKLPFDIQMTWIMVLCEFNAIGKDNLLSRSFSLVNSTYSLIIFTNPSARAGYDTRSIFKQSLTGLNSEFFFS